MSGDSNREEVINALKGLSRDDITKIKSRLEKSCRKVDEVEMWFEKGI